MHTVWAKKIESNRRGLVSLTFWHPLLPYGYHYKHHVADWVKPSFVFLTSGHSDAQGWASECLDVKNYKWWLNLVWHRMFQL